LQLEVDQARRQGAAGHARVYTVRVEHEFNGIRLLVQKIAHGGSSV
jgi:hypothetical protein